MSNALRDQLLKAGLVDEKRLNKNKPPKKKHVRQKRGTPAPPAPEAAAAVQARAQEAERSRALNRKQQEAAERKALAAQVKQLIDAHKLPRTEGDLSYAFQHGAKVRHVHVTPEQQRALAAGRLAVVTLAGGYELVPREAADKIAERDASRVVVCIDPNAPKAPPAPDDPYAGYEVPDDLIW